VVEEPDDLRVQPSDVELLLDTVNETLAEGVAPMTLDDVVDTTLGVRPLMVDEGKSSYTASRRHEIYDHGRAGVKNLWSIGGGKWTTGRATAVQMLDVLVASPALSAATPRRFDSRRLAVFGAFEWAADAEPFLAEMIASRPEIELEPDVRAHLARLYGTECARVLDLVAREPALAERISQRPGRLDISAQAVVAVTDEGARTLSDVLDRRLVIGTLGPVELDEIERVGAVIGPLLGWDAGRIADEASTEHQRRIARRSIWRAVTH
jgi:glycerol-3-phosphate dehydrogenase